MIRNLLFTINILILIGFSSCNKTKEKTESGQVSEIPTVPEVFEGDTTSIEIKKKPEDFIPKGYVPFDTIKGDFNKDGLEDCILIIKGTDKSKIIQHEYRGELDRNRRGIIALLNKNGGYELAAKNYSCFSSENEEGGVYYAPELDLEIKNGKLYINYAHGRYGYWSYTFRYQNNDLEMIGYDSSENHGPIVLYKTSINFLTKMKIESENINRNVEDSEEVFEKTETKIKRSKLIKLSEIKDFDELHLYDE
ncbi:hypothetical protein [Flavobacterium sp. KACC 22763]|uniref:hypothetical protein n=1 Tax=Flavobacterium sp. KACC 22763 TaxID=3025668 RepID=UPI002366E0E4|nr:hypothetical protein [Flavobacterium sp. KACC 22763]WDF63403.1 hypothetical protein PQ463_17490 [Flavobacterium sp. KACC 22763]